MCVKRHLANYFLETYHFIEPILRGELTNITTPYLWIERKKYFTKLIKEEKEAGGSSSAADFL